MHKTRTAYGNHVNCQSKQNDKDVLRTSHTSVNNSLALVLLKENIPGNQKQDFPNVVMFVFQSGPNEELYTEPSIGASYQMLINLAKWFEERFL